LLFPIKNATKEDKRKEQNTIELCIKEKVVDAMIVKNLTQNIIKNIEREEKKNDSKCSRFGHDTLIKYKVWFESMTVD